MPDLRVKDLMSSQVIAVGPEDDLSTLRDLMLDHDIRHIPVVEDASEVVGLVSHRDLLRSSLIEQSEISDYMEQATLERIQAREVMTEGVECVDAEADIREAASTMVENKYGCLPVTEDRRLVGILTESDFVRFLAQGD